MPVEASEPGGIPNIFARLAGSGPVEPETEEEEPQPRGIPDIFARLAEPEPRGPGLIEQIETGALTPEQAASPLEQAGAQIDPIVTAALRQAQRPPEGVIPQLFQRLRSQPEGALDAQEEDRQEARQAQAREEAVGEAQPVSLLTPEAAAPTLPAAIAQPQQQTVQAAPPMDPKMAEAQTLNPAALAETGERASRLVESARRILGMGIQGASAVVRALGMSPIEAVDEKTKEIAGILDEMGGRISQEEAQAIAESRARSGIGPSQDLFDRLKKTPVKTLADEAPEVVGSIAGGMLAAGMTGMGAGMSLLGIGEQYERAREEGLSEEEAIVQAIPTGMAIGALERTGLSKILGAGRTKWFLPRARKAIEAVATEGGTEFAQEFVADLGSTLDRVRRGEAGFGDLRTLVAPESIRRYAQAGTLGALGGGLAGGAMPGAAAQAVTEGPQTPGTPPIQEAGPQAAEARQIRIAEPEPGTARPAIPEEAELLAPKPTPEAIPRPEATTAPAVRMAPTSEIRLDPDRFQYKIDPRPLDVARWNPEAAGILAVWTDPADGVTYVVNGHRRLGAAQRLRVPEVPVRQIQAETAAEARAVGAVINIAEGHGTPIDAAKFFRDTGLGREDLEARGVSLTENVAAKGLALSQIADGIFNEVAVGRFPVERGVILGEILAGDPQTQIKLADLIDRREKRGQTLNNETIRELAKDAREAPRERVPDPQASLFGEPEAESLVIQKAELKGEVLKQLKREKRLFGLVSKAQTAKELEAAGNVIERARNEQVSLEAAQVLEVFDRLKNAEPFSGILNEGARRIANGEPRAQVARDLYPQIRGAMAEALGGAEGQPGQRAPDRGKDREPGTAEAPPAAAPQRSLLEEPETPAIEPRRPQEAAEEVPPPPTTPEPIPEPPAPAERESRVPQPTIKALETATGASREDARGLSRAVRVSPDLHVVHDPDAQAWRVEYAPDPTKPSDRSPVPGVSVPGPATLGRSEVLGRLGRGLEQRLRPQEAPNIVERTVEEAIPKEKTRKGTKPLGIVAPGAVRVGRETEIAGEKISQWARRTFTREGGLPAELFEKGVNRDGKFAALDRQLQFDLRDLQRRIKAYKGPLTRDQLERYLGDAYRGMNVRIGAETAGFDEAQIRRIAKRRGIPEGDVRAEFERVREREPRGLAAAPEFLPVISRIRLTADAMTRDLRRMGELNDDVQRKLEKTYGLYAHRDYDAFRDKDWRKRAKDQPLWSRAKELFAKENPRLTDEEVEGLMNAFLDRPQSILPGGIPEGARNLGPLMKRNEVADWKRRLLGERRDVLSQHLDTAALQAQLIYNYQHLNDLVQTGMDKYFFEKPTGEFYKPIDPAIFPVIGKAKGGEAKIVYIKGGKRRTKPLSGLYTSPEIHEALERMFRQNDLSIAARIYFGLNFLTKFGLTAGSVQTQNRNFLSNAMPAMANGYFPFSRGFADAFGLVMRDLAGKSNQDLSRRLQFLDALAVTKQSTDYGDLRRLSKYIDSLKLEMTEEGGIDAFLEKGVKTWPRRGLRKLSEIYRAYGDDTWKVFAFYKEKARLTKALGEEVANKVVRSIKIGDQEFDVTRADEDAAKIVRKVQQNYGELPKFWREVSKHPIVGPFASFTGSMLINIKNTAEQAKTELRSDNPKIQAIGMRRAGGLLFTLSLPTLFANSLAWLLNMDDDDEEAIRTFAAPWDRNATLIPMKRERGKYVFFNAGFMDYHGRLKQPMMAAYRAVRGRTKPADPVIELLEMAGGTEEILAGALADIRSNKKEGGGEVWNPVDPMGIRVAKAAEHIWDRLKPGTFRSADRIWMAAQGKVTPTGRAYDLAHELLALAGPRITTIDTAQSMEHWVAGGTVRSIADATRIYNREANTRGTPDKKAIIKAYANANRARLEIVRELRKYIDGAAQSGLTIEEVSNAYKRGNGTQKYFDLALHGDAGRVTLLDPRKAKHFEVAADELAELARKFVNTGEFYYSDEF